MNIINIAEDLKNNFLRKYGDLTCKEKEILDLVGLDNCKMETGDGVWINCDDARYSDFVFGYVYQIRESYDVGDLKPYYTGEQPDLKPYYTGKGCDSEATAPADERNDSKGGTKYDSGKLRIELIPAEATEGIAEVLSMGAVKYGDNNWKGGLKFSRVIGALRRHLLEIEKGNDIDEESGLNHSHHIACNAAFLQYFFERYNDYKGFDDRDVRK